MASVLISNRGIRPVGIKQSKWPVFISILSLVSIDRYSNNKV